MDFTLTDEQELLVDTARSLLGREFGSTQLREVINGQADGTALFERHLRDWVALADGPTVDWALFGIELGAACAPGPFLVTAGLFTPLLLAIDHPLAPAAVAGEITGTVAIAGADGVWRPNDDPVRTQVIDLDRVDHVAVIGTAGPAGTGGTGGTAGPGAATLAVLDAPALTAQRIDTLDLLRTVHRFEIPDGTAFDALPIETLPLDRMTLTFAAELVGTARWALDTAVAYAKERVQFDRPIGSFQAIQHKLADAALTYERAAAALSAAAMRVDAGDPEAEAAVHVAKVQADIAAKRCTRDAVQVLGGVGFTWEHDLHLRVRRATATSAIAGTDGWHLDRIAELIFDSPQFD